MARVKDESYRRPKAFWHRHMVWRTVRSSWHFFIWLAAVLVAFILVQDTAIVAKFNGVVETAEEPIAPLDTARIKSINVILGQSVKAGDIVVQMDTSLLDARIAIEQARIAEAESSIRDDEQRLLNFVRDFEKAVQDASFELAVQQWSQRRDEAELAALKDIMSHFEALRSENLIGEEEMASLRPQIASLQQTVNAYPAIVAAHSNRVSDAISARSEMRRVLLAGNAVEASDDADNEHFEILAAVKERSEVTRGIFESTAKRRELQRETYSLRATRDGIVSGLSYLPGDVVQAGQQIVRIVDEAPTRVIGFLPEMFLGEVKVGDRLRILELSSTAHEYTAIVQSISPDVQALPGRISPVRGRTVRGRNVILKLDAGHQLVPGQSVSVASASGSLVDRIKALFN